MLNSIKLIELTSNPAMLFVSSIFLMETMLLLAALFTHIYKQHPPKTVTIIRGVPGAGKKYLISQLERDNDDIFAICDKNQYFTLNGEYNFTGSELSKANQSSRIKLLNSISNGINTIYVINYFDELWMYQEYLQIAKMHNYKTDILEIPCPDMDHLSYFNKRSSHKTPYSKSKSCYDNWEKDDRAIYYEPYIKGFPGDSLPKTKPVNLNKQLDDYKTDTSVEVPSNTFNFMPLIKYGEIIDFMSQFFHTKIFKREVNVNTKLKKNIKYDLKEHAPFKL